MSPQEIFKELQERETGGGRHRNLIEYLKSSKHNRFAISDDESLCIAYFKNYLITIVPYGIINLYEVIDHGR